MDKKPLENMRGEPPIYDKPVQRSLILVLPIKQGEAVSHYAKLVAILKPGEKKSPLRVGLDRLKTVHFARFFFIKQDYLCLVTSYDGDFDDYIKDFTEAIGDIFNVLLQHVQEPPPLPVQLHRGEFLSFIRKHDLPAATGPVYCAYPNLSVVRILTLAGEEAHNIKLEGNA